MKAIVYEEFGSPDVLKLMDVEKPLPKNNELLIKVHATSVNALDIIFRSGASLLYGVTKLMAGFKKPKSKVLGFDVSGEVVSIGKDVTKFKEGDLVYGAGQSPGANAEYYCISENTVALKPSSISHEEAATIPDVACTAYTGLIDKVSIKENQKVLIYGASGGVGIFAIQIAKLFTNEVTAVCSTDKLDQAKELGAKQVIDYTKEDFTKNGQTYDVIFDAVGRKKITYKGCRSSLSKEGIFVTVDLESVLFSSIFSKRISSYFAKVDTERLNVLRNHIEKGKIRTVVEKTFPLIELAEAHRYYEKGHLKGKIAITVIE